MSPKYNTSDAKQQYLEIRNNLNRSNKLKNLNSELVIIICNNNEEDFIILKSSQAKHGLRLAFRKTGQVFWVKYNNENYPDFFDYIFFKIRQLVINDDVGINQILTGWLNDLWCI